MRAVDRLEVENNPVATAEGGEGAPSGSEKTVETSWSDAVRLLEQAAAIAAARGCDPQSFTNAAFAAYVAKNPAFRQWLETAQLAHRLDHLRREGRVGVA
ncbi:MULTISPECIES: hypothetical protein [unclassified Sorangium]|uniref:hypothetical protein n=1 Tax=unclassified Sorangium TaxID=2621164 RepID=UPI003F5AF9C2